MCIFELYRDYKQQLELCLKAKDFMDANNMDKNDSRYLEMVNGIDGALRIVNKIEELIFILQMEVMLFVDDNVDELEGLNQEFYVYDEEHNRELKEEFEEDLLGEDEEEDNWWDFEDDTIYDKESEFGYDDDFEDDLYGEDDDYGDDDLGYEEEVD